MTTTNYAYECFTSRGETSPSRRKARQMERLVPPYPCHVQSCRAACGSDEDRSRHEGFRHRLSRPAGAP